MPTTTAESTMPTSVIRRCVPSQYQAQLIADLDRLQAQDANDTSVVHAEVGKANRAHHSEKLRAAVAAMAERHQLQLTEWTGTLNARNRWLQNQIKFAMEREGGFMNLKKLPSLWLIGDVLKTMKF